MIVMTRLRLDILRHLSAGDMSSGYLAAICERTTTATAQALLQMEALGLVRAAGFAPSRLRGCKPRIFTITERGSKALLLLPNMDAAGPLARYEVAA